jgi:hypothetical protein
MHDTGWDQRTRKLIVKFRWNIKAKRETPKLQITLEEWKNFWKGSKERTSCGSDILHFGTWKAGAHIDIISEVDTPLTNILMQSGYSPALWRMVVDALLLKKSGVTLIEKLWTIVLFWGGGSTT